MVLINIFQKENNLLFTLTLPIKEDDSEGIDHGALVSKVSLEALNNLLRGGHHPFLSIKIALTYLYLHNHWIANS